jgi:hypothetical protein
MTRSALRRTITLAAVACSGAVLLAIHSACVLTVPGKTCKPFAVNGIVDHAKRASQSVCETCLEDHCCDAIGRCDDEGESCENKVLATHQCVLDAGPDSSEQGCAAANLSPAGQSVAAYQCMHDSCGTECGLPVCQVSSTYGVLVAADCDQCVSSACCPELNDCANNRACKLVDDCVVRVCGAAFFDALGSADLAQLASTRQSVCSAAGPPPPLSPCIDKCIADFGNYEQSFFEPDKRAACLGLRVVECIAGSKCAPICARAAEAGVGSPAADAGGGG